MVNLTILSRISGAPIVELAANGQLVGGLEAKDIQRHDTAQRASHEREASLDVRFGMAEFCNHRGWFSTKRRAIDAIPKMKVLNDLGE